MDSAPTRRWCSACKRTRPIADFPLRRGAREDDPNAERALMCEPCTETRRRRRLQQRVSRGETPGRAVPEEAETPGRAVPEEAVPEEAEGDQAEGDQAEGDQAEGDQAEGDQAEGYQVRDANLKWCSCCRRTRRIADFPLKRGASDDDPNAERALTCQPCKETRRQRRLQQRVSRGETSSRAVPEEAVPEEAVPEEAEGDQAEGDQAEGDQAEGDQARDANLKWCSGCRRTRRIADFPLKRGASEDDPDAERALTCQPCKETRRQRRLQQRASRQETPSGAVSDETERRCSSCKQTRPIANFPPKRGSDQDDPNPEKARTCLPCKVSRDRRRLQERRSRDAATRAAAARASQTAALPVDDDTIPSTSPPQRQCSSCGNQRPVTDFLIPSQQQVRQSARLPVTHVNRLPPMHEMRRTCASCR
ncbi:hypothetical protein E4U34_005871, partial [Claviceps purpurea]